MDVALRKRWKRLNNVDMTEYISNRSSPADTRQRVCHLHGSSSWLHPLSMSSPLHLLKLRTDAHSKEGFVPDLQDPAVRNHTFLQLLSNDVSKFRLRF